MNRSPLAEGHPHYVFGEKNGKYKSLGLTHDSASKTAHVKLSSNPNPSDSSDSYLQMRVHTAKKEYYSQPLSGWGFAKEDWAIVRHRTKKYKKSYNKKPPFYYERKKAKKKKRSS